MNVLSVFDGMSCGQIALKENNVKVDKYYASEIDKDAIAQTQLNFPGTIQIGSVTDVDVSKLDYIDLLIGGSPCQSFSFAGKRKGMATKCEIEITKLEQYLDLKEQGFEFEGQSYLFWEYMRILTDIRKYNPNVKFLLENVEMGAKWEAILSNAIGIKGVHINSSLVSAQSRRRIYWTNIKTKNYGLFGDTVADIPQPKDHKILLKDILEEDVDEKYYLNKSRIDFLQSESGKRMIRMQFAKINGDKSMCLTARGDASWNCQYITTEKGIRKLSPREWMNLQTIPQWYVQKCNDSEMYRMLGNGWTVEVIKHIFSFLNIKNSNATSKTLELKQAS